MLWLKFKMEHQLLQCCTESNESPIRKGVRQGDTISPNLFTATLEDLFCNCDWSNRGVSINGNKLSNLRFADDVTIIAHGLEEREISLNELSVASMQHGLRINMAKTKVFRNKHVTQRPVIVEGSVIKEVESYIYLGQRVQLAETDMENEINRRVGKVSMSMKSC